MRKVAWLVLVSVLLVGCGSGPAGSDGFVAGDGTLTVLPVDQRPAAPLVEGTTLDGAAWRSDSAPGTPFMTTTSYLSSNRSSSMRLMATEPTGEISATGLRAMASAKRAAKTSPE